MAYFKHNKIQCKIEKEEHGGVFAKQLVRFSSQVDADLIVISSYHDHDVVMDFFIGSHEVQIINNEAQIAVMCVNPIEPVRDVDVTSFNW